MNTRGKSDLASILSDRTSDAFSWDAYGEGKWRACIKMLLARGYSECETEAIMRSKWTRWAGDAAKTNRYGYYNSADLARFLDSHSGRGPGDTEVNELVAGTFTE